MLRHVSLFSQLVALFDRQIIVIGDIRAEHSGQLMRLLKLAGMPSMVWGWTEITC